MQLIDMIDDLAQIVAAADLVSDFPEDLADLVFKRGRPAGPLLETLQVWEKPFVDGVA